MNDEDNIDPELCTIETGRERITFWRRNLDPDTEVLLNLNKLSLNIRSSRKQNNELLLQRAELCLKNSHLNETFLETAYADLKAILDDVHASVDPKNEQMRARVYVVIENNHAIYEKLRSYEPKLWPETESTRFNAPL